MHELLNQYFAILIQCFQYDIHIYTLPWVWYWIIPVLFYTWFFFIKWTVLLFPLCLPFYLVIWIIAAIRETYKEKQLLFYLKQDLVNHFKEKTGGLKK